MWEVSLRLYCWQVKELYLQLTLSCSFSPVYFLDSLSHGFYSQLILLLIEKII